MLNDNTRWIAGYKHNGKFIALGAYHTSAEARQYAITASDTMEQYNKNHKPKERAYEAMWFIVADYRDWL